MHYSTLVILRERPADLEAAVAELLKPYEDHHWDGYQIGGRWTGFLDGYDPEADLANVVTCQQCGGTGVRPGGLAQFGATWFKEMNGCNGCRGKGTHLSWPTQRAGDVVPVAALTEQHLEVCNVVPEGWGWFVHERYEPWADGAGAFPKQDLPPLARLRAEFPTGVAVIVDVHN